MIMGSPDDHQNNQIVKGKRTKRQRSSSPFGFAVTDSSSSGDNSGGDDSYYYNNNNNNNNNNSVMSFPTTSGESTEEEEDQDMANCLIMLAQGDDRSRQINQENIIDDRVQKFNASRKFTTAVTPNNKAGAGGFYVYECKTCNRSFPSFQALGGHRASHKKPKATLAEAAEKKSSSSSYVPGLAAMPTKNEYKDSYGTLHHHDQSHVQPAAAAAAAANNNTSNNNNNNNNNNKGGNKIHECSICGSEFTSGQALGGHMRRHRAAVATGNNNINQVTTIESNIGDVQPVAATRSILPLDLNLPAPEDDHHIRFGTTQQSLVFSAPALVDCHY